MKAAQANRHHSQAAIHTIQQGDRGGAGATPDIQERDD
jgi:type IV secretion system protein TrbL